MIQRILLLALVIIISPYSGIARDKESKTKPGPFTVFILNGENKSPKYDYYGTILTRSLKGELGRLMPGSSINIYPDMKPIQEYKEKKSERRKLRYLKKFARKNKSRYLIFGTYIVRREGIYVSLRLFDRKKKTIHKIYHNSHERGAVLVEIIGGSALKIYHTLFPKQKIKIEVPEELKKEDEREQPEKKPDSSEYIDKFKDRINLTIRPAISWQNLRYELISGGTTLAYSPNIQWKTGGSIGFKTISLLFLTKPGKLDIQKDNDTFGNSLALDARAHFYYRNLGIDLFYEQYDNFYLTRLRTSDDQRFRYTEMKTSKYGGNFYYIFSGNKFSMSALADQSERQKKSKGSVFIMGYAHRLVFHNDIAIIPSAKVPEFRSIEGFEGVDLITAGTGVGYALNIAISRFYISPAAFLGMGGQRQEISLLDRKIEDYQYAIKIGLKLNMGYNGDHFISGLSFSADYEESPLKKYSFASRNIEGIFTIGARI